MARIHFLFTSALMLSAAVAAPINTNHGKVDTSAPSKHHSEPMRMTDAVMSSVPVMSIDAQAMKSSAAAMAVQTPSSSASGQQGDAVFGVLNTLPVKRGHEERRQLDEVTKILTSINSIFKRGDEERRQLDEVTKILTSINSIFKRDELEERQLGLVKSVPEAVGQAAQVEKLLTSLPIKRDGSDNLKDLGGLGGVLLKRDTERAESHDETYTEKALKGFQGWLHHGSQKDKQETPEIPSAADSIGLGDVAKPSSATLAKRDAEESESHDATYTEKALKGFQGWLHHGSKDHKQETPEKPSAVDSLGLTDVIKRSTPTDPISSLLSGIIGKREIGDSLATSEDVADALDRLAKRSGLDSVDQLIKGLTKGGQLNNGLSLRQLDVVSNLATGALSNAGSATGQLGKIAAGKFRRGNVEAGSIADAATAGLNVGDHNHKASKEDDSSDVDGVAEEVAEKEQALHDATASSDGHLDKRQVPPIAGSDALSIVTGLVANPKAALDPVAKGVLVGGTPLGDLAPK